MKGERVGEKGRIDRTRSGRGRYDKDTREQETEKRAKRPKGAKRASDRERGLARTGA